ncbi:hypothetical protein LTS17_008917 [Exophiala oligosperma]
MLSDRKATVGYAVDLLRFHQVRRENAYLHAQTQAYHDELTLTKAEVKELKTAVQQCQADSENSHSLSKWYELRADQQGDQIRRLQRDLEMLKAETSKHQDESERNLTHATAETRLLEEKLFSRIETLCQQAADTSRSRLQTLNVRLDGFEAVLSNKADLTLVERLHRSIDPTQPPHASLDSVSRVDNSVEEHLGLQVHDSQATYLPEMPTNPPLNAHRDAAVKPAVQPSIPSDLDLDENVNTVSYAGHRVFGVDENDSLSFLSEPRAPADELTKANNLMQERFESWEHYYSRALRLVQTLPATFEEMVVRRFAEGIFQTVQRKQCQQWLELKGWAWENVGSFGSISSQVPPTPNSNNAGSVEISARYSKKVELLLGQGGLAKWRMSNTLANVPTENKEKPATVSLRRSQRLIEKDNRIAMETAKGSIDSGSQVMGGKFQKNIPDSRLQKRTGQKRNAPVSEQYGTLRPKETHFASRKNDNRHLKATAGQNAAAARGRGPDDEEGKAQSTAMCKDTESIGPGSSEQGPTGGNRKKPRGHVRHLPRLVPQKRVFSKASNESSGDEGYLYEQPVKNNDAHEMPAAKCRRVERRLPLPPPPEIPIVSTSSDG